MELKTYWSLDEFADACESMPYGGGQARPDFNMDCDQAKSRQLARLGWDEYLSETLNIAESALELCDRELDILKPEMRYDVAGDSVDIGRYLAGEPECMTDYPLQPTSSHGRVIILEANVIVSSAISVDTFIRRGQVITALAMVLQQLGHSCELWVGSAVHTFGSRKDVAVRILVKGANDTVDPSRILFAYAHPAFSRNLTLGALDWMGNGHSRGQINGLCEDMPHDLPEGTLYLPNLTSSRDLPEAPEMLKDLLRQLDLLTD